MKSKKILLNYYDKNVKKMLILIIMIVFACLIYQFTDVDIKHFDFAMKIRTPKLIGMIVAAFCVGSASIIFQTIINNLIVTPCLLGMNSLYVLVHTIIIFVFGSTSIFTLNKLFSFSFDLFVMGVISFFVYGLLFKKTDSNVLYILLVGSVLSTLFSSMSTTIQRVMDPNEFDQLQSSIVAGFDRVNSNITNLAIIFIFLIFIILFRELKLLDVIVLGRNQSINLGVDYDKVIQKLLIGVTLLIGIATALVGPISFLGLIVANLGRQIFKTYKHIYLIFGTAFIGMIILLIGQTLIEQVFEFNANIGAFVNIGGGIYFLYLILKNKG